MDPTDIDVEEARTQSILRRARAHLPGQVVSYNPATARAVIDLGLVGKTAQGVADVPVRIPDAPVVWPRFGGCTVIGRLNPGDEVLCAIADRSIDRWLVSGGPVLLESDRMHELTDAVAIPGLCSGRTPRPDASVDMLVGREDGTATIRLRIDGAGVVTIEAPTINLGALTPANNQIAIARLVHSYLLAMLNTGVPGPADGGAALRTAWTGYLAANAPAAMAATKARAE